MQQAENNISKLVAGIFCKLSEEQFILGVDLIHPDPLNPPRDLRISGHHPHNLSTGRWSTKTSDAQGLKALPPSRQPTPH